MITVSDVLRNQRSLPALPASFTELSRLVNDEKAGFRSFENVLQIDPALTASVLQMANSAYFGCPREVRSVAHAIAMLGSRRVYEIATSAAMAGLIPDHLPGYEISAPGFWLHSVAVAVLAERLATELGLTAPDMTFTAGILHDIGKLVIGVYLSRQASAVSAELREQRCSLVAAEASIIGVDHAEVGGVLTRKWNLPQPIRDAVRWHHDPGRSRGDSTLVDLVHIADGLAHSLGYGADVGELARAIDPEVPRRLGIKVQRLEHVACDALADIQTLSETFDDRGGS